VRYRDRARIAVLPVDVLDRSTPKITPAARDREFQDREFFEDWEFTVWHTLKGTGRFLGASSSIASKPETGILQTKHAH
jgi:hypothetical protein